MVYQRYVANHYYLGAGGSFAARKIVKLIELVRTNCQMDWKDP